MSNKINEIKALHEKLEKLTGKKVVYENASCEENKMEESEWEEGLDEGLFGPSEDQIKKDYLQTINAWAAKGYKKPTDQEFAQIMAQAKADKFQGKLGVKKDKTIGYRSAKDIKWATQFGGGGTGGNPTGGTTGA
jgi:hypothetical protein